MKTILLTGVAIIGAYSVGFAQQSDSNKQGQSSATQSSQSQNNQTQSTQPDQSNRGTGGEVQGTHSQSSITVNSGGTSTSDGIPVTGCLEKGTGAGSYTITATNGKQYNLRPGSSSVNLGSHVGHQVTVTGSQSGGNGHSASSSGNSGRNNDASNRNSDASTRNNDTYGRNNTDASTRNSNASSKNSDTASHSASSNRAGAEGSSSSNGQAADLEVTSLTMVSMTCQR